MQRYISILILLLFLFGLTAACSDEPRNFVVHEPGQYKGKIDPLIAKGEHPGLKERLLLVQTDR